MLDGKVILITGSTSGIGFGTAKAALDAGARVFLHGPDADILNAASERLGGVGGIAADLTLPESGAQIVDAALAAYGRLDGVVNNAGLFPRAGLEATDAGFFDHVMAVNARAPLMVARRAVEVFRAQKTPASIVNIGSVNAYAGQTDLLAYSMSKGALMTMTRNLADGLAVDRIRVNQLNLDWTLTETEIRTQRAQGRPEDWYKTVSPLFAPTGGLFTPELVANHVLFWLSELSAPVTGQVYEVSQVPFLGRNLTGRVV